MIRHRDCCLEYVLESQKVYPAQGSEPEYHRGIDSQIAWPMRDEVHGVLRLQNVRDSLEKDTNAHNQEHLENTPSGPDCISR